MTRTRMNGFGLPLSDLALWSEQLLQRSLSTPGPLTFTVVFSAGLVTSLGPCSLSLLPITVAYMAGFSRPEAPGRPWQRSLSFAAGIVAALVLLGAPPPCSGSSMARCPGWFPPWWLCWRW